MFRWSDALTFGLAAVLATAAAAWVQITPYEAPLPAKVIGWATALGFWLVYAMLLRWRDETISRIDYVTRHGIYVLTNGHPVKQVDIEAYTEHVLERWETESQWPGVRRSVEHLYLLWERYPFRFHQRPNFKWTGLASGTSHAVIVGYREPLTSTALGHELGHIVYGAWQGPHSEEQFHAFTVPHSLLY